MSANNDDMRITLTSTQAIRRLDSLDVKDPETAHAEADTILMLAVAPEVRDAYRRVMSRASWWATA